MDSVGRKQKKLVLTVSAFIRRHEFNYQASVDAAELLCMGEGLAQGP